MNKKTTLYLILMFFNFNVIGQQFQQTSLYMYNALYYNPAYAGTRNSLSASLVAREQWVGLDGAPSTQWLSIHSPLKRKEISLGTHINYDRIGGRSKTSAYVDASTSIKLNKKDDRLAIGLSAGVDNYLLGFGNLYAIDANDPIVNNYSLLKPNVGAGLYYYGERHYFGLSVPMILEWTEDLYNTNISKRHYVLTAGYVFSLNSVLDLKPSTLVKFIPGAPLVFDLNASLFAYKKFWIGAMYRYDEGVGVNLAYVINNNFTVGYAYDYPINGLRTVQTGSHEIMLQFDYSLFNKNKQIYSPRYF